MSDPTQPQPNTIILSKVKPKEFATNHANATPASLLDEIKELRDAEKLAKSQADLLKVMLFARHEPQILQTAQEHGTVLKSDNNTATLSWVVQSRFDTESFSNDYPDLFKKYQKKIEFMQLKFSKD